MSWQDYARHPGRLPAKLKRMAQNAWLDRRYGIRAHGIVQTPFAANGAYDTLSTQVSALSVLFAKNTFPIHQDDVLVDVGCGRGRVLAYWLSRGLSNRLIGIELNPEVAADTARRFRKFSNVSIRTGDVVEMFPAEGTVFFLFSPFDSRVMARFRDTVRARTTHPDRVRIVYYNDTEIAVFKQQPGWVIQGVPVSRALLFRAAYITLERTV